MTGTMFWRRLLKPFTRLHLSVTPDRTEPGARCHNARSVQPSRPPVIMAPVWRSACGRMRVNPERGDFPLLASFIAHLRHAQEAWLTSTRPLKFHPGKRLRGFSLAV